MNSLSYDDYDTPPVECNGYFPVLQARIPPSSCIKEENFYLSSYDKIQIASQMEALELSLQDESRIACSIHYHINESDPVASPSVSPSNAPSWIDTMNTEKPLIILCHGANSWRNQMLILHLGANLAEELNCHVLRFDFLGNGHSSGTWNTSQYDRELLNLRQVVHFVRRRLSCRILAIAGHSKGWLASLRFALGESMALLKQESTASKYFIPCYINLAGSYMTPCSIEEVLEECCNEEQRRELERKGYFMIDRDADDERREQKVTMKDLLEKTKIDVTECQNIVKSDVLSIYGDKDEKVSMYNAYQYAAVLTNNEIRIIKGADHNFNGLKHIKTLTAIISDFIVRKGSSIDANTNEQHSHWLANFERD